MPRRTDETGDSFTRVVDWAEGFKGFKCQVELKEVQGAGHGLVTTTRVESDQTLLLVPSSALLNPLTLLTSTQNTVPQHLFPEQQHKPEPKRRRVSISLRLNTTQLLTLHLALTRDPKRRHKSAWQVYIGTLPQSFRPWHPLTWVFPPPKGKVVNGHDDVGLDMLSRVPREARDNVMRVKKRFDEDSKILQRVLKLEEPFKEQNLYELISIEDLLWAWLIVNTRSVSLPLGLGTPTDLFNHTLVPILDLVNHSSDPEECISKPRQIPTPSPSSSLRTKTRPRTNAHLIPGKIAFELRSERDLEAGEELRFEYHPHANSELWAEYGFAERSKRGWADLRWGQVDVSRHLAGLWEVTDHRVDKEEALKACGCFEINTLVTRPEVGPSHGLLMTLRVLHLSGTEIKRLKSIAEAQTTYVSPSNERLVNATLEDLCQKCIKEGEDGLAAIREEKGSEWDCVRTLWEEQVGIAGLALAGLQSKQNGH